MSGRRVAAPILAALALATAGPGALAAQSDARSGQEPRRVTLEEAVQVALSNNPALTRSRTDREIAEYGRLSAYGEFLPDLSLGYGFSNASSARLDPTQQSLTRTSYTLQLGASMEIFDGLRRFSNLESARRDVTAQEARYREQRYRTTLEVKQAFYNAVANRELVAVEEDRVERQEDQLELVRQQVELGRSSRSDLLRSQVDLNDARLALINARNQARSATFALAEAMGVSRRVAPVAEAKLETEELPLDREELLRVALARGPSVRAAEASARAAEAEVDAARSTFLPSLSFNGGWAWQNTAFPPENRSWSLSLTGSYPLFDGFDRETAVFRARARAQAARAQQREARLALRSGLDEALSQVEAALAGVDLARQSVELSREDLRVTRERYRLGLATILDLQSAQIALRQAQADLVRRRFDYQVGVARLESILGEGLSDGLDGAGGDAPGREETSR